MTEIALSSSFRKAFKRAVRGKPDVEKRFWERVAIFQENPLDPRLRTHKLSGTLKDLWSFSIEYDVRVVFAFVKANQVLFIDIGTHDEVY